MGEWYQSHVLTNTDRQTDRQGGGGVGGGSSGRLSPPHTQHSHRQSVHLRTNIRCLVISSILILLLILEPKYLT